MRPGTFEHALFPEAHEFCFETDRLQCRLLSEADQVLYRSLYCCEIMMRYIMKPLTQAAAEQSFERALHCTELHPLQRLFLVVASKADKTTLGILGISSLDWEQRSVEYGLILTRAGQGKSYAIEVSKACLHHLTEVMGMKRVWVDIAEQNHAALKVARLAGFRQCRTNTRMHEYLIASDASF